MILQAFTTGCRQKVSAPKKGRDKMRRPWGDNRSPIPKNRLSQGVYVLCCFIVPGSRHV